MRSGRPPCAYEEISARPSSTLVPHLGEDVAAVIQIIVRRLKKCLELITHRLTQLWVLDFWKSVRSGPLGCLYRFVNGRELQTNHGARAVPGRHSARTTRGRSSALNTVSASGADPRNTNISHNADRMSIEAPAGSLWARGGRGLFTS